MIKLLMPQKGLTVEIGPLTTQHFPAIIDAVFQLVRENIANVTMESGLPREVKAPETQTVQDEFLNAQKLGLVEQDGRIMVSSRDIARVFEKKHKTLLETIRSLHCSREFAVKNFQLCTYKDRSGRSLPEYLMTRDGVMFLVMAFTGKLSAEFKEAYVNAFNVMEAMLRQR